MANNNPGNNEEKNLILDDEQDLLMDHEYDGIQELDNPMPKWWLWGFYVTIAFSVLYLLYYDVTGWGPSQEEEYEQELAMAAERYGLGEEESVDFAKFSVLSDEARLAAGRAVYESSRNQCATCHGDQGQGMVGPNLTDNYWKHGCDLESIMISISEGLPAQGMPAYGTGQRLSTDELHELASYIMSIRGSDPPNPKEPDMSRAVVCE